MIDPLGIVHLLKWPLIILFGIVVIVGIVGALLEMRGGGKADLSAYVKRKFLFDTKSEFELFKMLLALYGDKFHVFPQVHYSHIVEARKDLNYRDRLRYWNKINRKSADFVLCDKERVVPQIVIELDGSSHDWAARKERDAFINDLMLVTELKICHLHPERMNEQYVREEIEKVLNPVPVATV